MSTTPKVIILGSLLCLSGSVVWINTQDSSVTSPLAKTSEMTGLFNTNTGSINHLKHDNFTLLINKMQAQLSAQQDQLIKQQVAIDTLISTLKNRELFLSMQVNSDNGANLNLEADDENITKQIEILDTAFINEAIDEKWSNVAADKASEIFNQTIPEGVDVTQLDCLSTLCKISLEHLAEAELDVYLENFMFKLGWQASSFIQTTDNEDGSKATVVYLSRDGYSLPAV